MSRIDLSGQRFGRLTVTEFGGTRKRKTFWCCQCDCGTSILARADMLKSGNTKSCGCQKIDSATRHGHNRSRSKPSPTYVSWQSMIARCTKPTHTQYQRYGGRGIRVCDQWRTFRGFLADVGERPAGMSLDRINPAGHYEPGNVRWATPKEQSWNRRNNRILMLNGMSRPVGEWAAMYGIPRTVIQDRLRLGWSDAKAILTPHAKRSSEVRRQSRL